MSAKATDTAVAMNFMAGSPNTAAWPGCFALGYHSASIRSSHTSHRLRRVTSLHFMLKIQSGCRISPPPFVPGETAPARETLHVPQYQDAVQLRAAGDPCGNPRLRAAVRAEAVRLQFTLPGQYRSLQSRCLRSLRQCPAVAGVAANQCAGARPRNRGRKGQRTLAPAVWASLKFG